jgi:hypothetical protein
MSDYDRKKSVWPWAVLLVAGIPVLYVASWGPVNWFVNQYSCPEWIQIADGFVYWPLLWAIEHGPSWLSDALWWWVKLWTEGQ